jgi:ABC-type glycerol-3-phosphate transport system substrate-binding protein
MAFTRRALARTVGTRGSLAALGVVSAGWLAGCGAPGGGGSEAATSGASSPPARVTVMTFSNGVEIDSFKGLFAEFAKHYPNITVDFQPTGTGPTAAYNEKLVSLLASGDAPDAFKTAPNGFGQIANGGAYLALDDYVKRNAADVKPDDFFPPHLEGCKYRGKLYALPQSGAPQALWINVDLWQRESLPTPSWDTTWADLLKAAAAMTKRDETGTARQMGMSRPDWLSWLWSAGGDLYTADGTMMLIDQPASIEALAWLQDAVNKQRVGPNAQELADKTISDFTAGHLGTNVGNRGGLGGYAAIDSFTFDAAPLPKGPKGRVAVTAVGPTSIWASSKVKDAAFTVVNYMCSQEGQRVYIGNGTAHPSRKSVTQETWFKDYKVPRAASTRINTVFPDTLTRGEARATTPHPHEAEINQSVTNNLGALWNGTKSPKEVAAAIVAECAPLMNK